MFEIRTEAQRDWVEQKIEEFLPKVKDGTPQDDPEYIQLVTWSEMLADYDDIHYPFLRIASVSLRLSAQRPSKRASRKSISAICSRCARLISTNS